jgi:hypothetical protein
MNSYIDNALQRMYAPDDEGKRTARELSLLIGREVRSNPSYQRMAEDVLGPEQAEQRLSVADVSYATERLLDIVKSEDPPNALFVRALGATLDRRMIEPLLDLIDRYGEDPEQHLVISWAMDALAPFRGTFQDDAVRKLAERSANEDNREIARDFLDPATGYPRTSDE